MYIYRLPNWPEFSWNTQTFTNLLTKIHHKQGRLIGGMESTGFHICEKTILETLTSDVIKSSEIEGEILSQSQVRSSVAHHLGIEIAALGTIDKNIDGIVEMVLDATQHFNEPLTRERLFAWHTSLFPTGRSNFKKIKVGMWRTGSIQVVSGRMDKEVIYFEGPDPKDVDHEMAMFLDWFNKETTLNLILKASIAHLWFLTIHPFDDGNGRIGRAIADLLLARSEKSSQRFYSLSTQIQLERKDYYAILEKTQKGPLDITHWIEWFLGCLERAIDHALTTFHLIMNKSQFWASISNLPLNERQKKVINRLLDGFDGKLTSSKWAKLAKCSQDTAYRDILELINQGILIKNPEGGRSTSYSLKT